MTIASDQSVLFPIPFSRAIHESGHAVITLLLGGHFEAAFLDRPIFGYPGRHSGVAAFLNHMPWQSVMMVHLSGPVAEAHYNELNGLPRPAPGRISNGDAMDVVAAFQLLAQLGQPADFAPYLERTRRTVTKPGVWDWITRTATKLYATGLMSEDDVLNNFING